MLTCAQFYTDLASESDVENSVSSLANHPVKCFEGSALQEFKYERKKDEVRYAYQCCTKASVPTPSPTPLPTFAPTLEPSAEPTTPEGTRHALASSPARERRTRDPSHPACEWPYAGGVETTTSCSPLFR